MAANTLRDRPVDAYASGVPVCSTLEHIELEDVTMPETDQQQTSDARGAKSASDGEDASPEQDHEEGLTEQQAAKALNKIEALRRRLEPRG